MTITLMDRTAGASLPRRRSSCKARFLRAVLLLTILPITAASAQFSGPALPITIEVNPPLVETTDPAILFPPTHDIQFETGDALVVRLYGATDYSPAVRVGLDGAIQLPLIGLVPVKGLTIPQAERLIATRLVEAGMYRDPQVSIQITESPNQLATVIGEVHGVVPVSSGKRLFDVIAVAGGFTPTSSHTITIERPGLAQPIILSLGTDPSHSAAANVPIFPHDTIIVPRVGLVYLLGAFKTPAAIPLVQPAPLTLLQATSMGGGTVAGAKLGDMRIIRTQGQTRSVVNVNIKKIMDGKAPDPVLQADDIILLPNSVIKQAIETGGLGTALGVASILLYAFRN